VVDRGLGDADGISDHLQRRSADTVVGEQFQRSAQDAALSRSALDSAERPFGPRLLVWHRFRLAEMTGFLSRSATAVNSQLRATYDQACS
jgi:hypothetical protein